MDTLSQLLQTARLRAPLFADLRLGSGVSIGLPRLGCLPFHYLAKGSCRLRLGSRCEDLVEGDLAMPVHASHYRLETGAGERRFEVMDFAEPDDFTLDRLRTGMDRLLTKDVGGSAPQARILTALLVPGGRDGGPLIRDLPEMVLIRNVKSLLEPWLVAAIEFMSLDGGDHEPGRSAIAERLIEVIFIAALRKWLLEGDHGPGWMRGLSDPAVSRALNAMHAEPGRRWQLRELAMIAGQSRSTFAEHFRLTMNETPFSYLTRWRMHLAVHAVAQTDRSMADIAGSLGYTGTGPFTRAFRAALEQTPARYRRRFA